ncbi:MAG: hypothetical protein ACRERV_16705, partial [Methylococcales bacterium]
MHPLCPASAYSLAILGEYNIVSPSGPQAIQNFYQEILLWQKATMAAAGSDITSIIHQYCKFLAEHEIHLCRANVALMTLHPQIEAIRFVWHNTVITPDPVPSPTMFYRKVHYLDNCT